MPFEFPLVMISCPVVAAGSSNASGRGCGAAWAYPHTLFKLQFVHIENVWNSNSLACYYGVVVSKLGVVSTLEMSLWGTCLITASRKMKTQQLDTRLTHSRVFSSVITHRKLGVAGTDS